MSLHHLSPRPQGTTSMLNDTGVLATLSPDSVRPKTRIVTRMRTAVVFVSKSRPKSARSLRGWASNCAGLKNCWFSVVERAVDRNDAEGVLDQFRRNTRSGVIARVGELETLDLDVHQLAGRSTGVLRDVLYRDRADRRYAPRRGNGDEAGQPVEVRDRQEDAAAVGLAEIARGAGAEREDQGSERQESCCEFHMGILPLGC